MSLLKDGVLSEREGGITSPLLKIGVLCERGILHTNPRHHFSLEKSLLSPPSPSYLFENE